MASEDDITSTGYVIQRFFGELNAMPDRVPDKKIAIISTPRSGSKYFCTTLANTGRCGFPMEWVGSLFIREYVRYFKIEKFDLRQYLDFVIAKTTTENGVFALNFHIEHEMQWQKRRVDLRRLNFDRVYYLYREDKLSQAFSLAKARITGRWLSQQESERAAPQPSIRDSQIIAALQELCVQEEFYRAKLSAMTDRAFRYEDFIAEDTCFGQVFDDLELPHSDIQVFGSNLFKQRNVEDLDRIDLLKKRLGFACV